MPDLVAQLAAIRTRKGITQTEIARRMYVARSSISHLESGRKSPTVATLTRYAEAVGARITVEEA